MADSIINLISTELVIGDCTVDWTKKIANDAAVSTSGHSLVERGNGIYKYSNPNITEDSDFYIKETATPANFAVGIFSPADGDIARASVLLGQAESIIAVIESSRGHHTHAGTLFYWDPVNGNDAKDGLTKSTAKLTYSWDAVGGIHELLTDSNHDMVIILPGEPSGPTVINEYINVDTRYTFIRAMGRDIFVNATHNEACAILLSAEGCELSGVRVQTKITGSQKGICCTADFAWVHDVWVDFSRGSGIEIVNSSHCLIEDFTVQDAATGGSGHGVHILGTGSLTTRNFIRNAKILKNGDGGETDGIRIEGQYCDHNFVVGSDQGIIIHDNTGYGIREVDNANHTICVGPTINLDHNALGKYLLVGEDSIMENEGQWAKESSISDLSDKVDEKLNVNIAASGGSSQATYAEKGSTSKIFQGDVVLIPRYLVGDLTGNRLFFGARKKASDATYAIGEIECTNLTYDPVEDRTAYTIPFVASDTKTVKAGTYKCNTEVRDSDGTSNPVTGDGFDLVVINEIVK